MLIPLNYIGEQDTCGMSLVLADTIGQNYYCNGDPVQAAALGGYGSGPTFPICDWDLVGTAYYEDSGIRWWEL